MHITLLIINYPGLVFGAIRWGECFGRWGWSVVSVGIVGSVGHFPPTGPRHLWGGCLTVPAFCLRVNGVQWHPPTTADKQEDMGGRAHEWLISLHDYWWIWLYGVMQVMTKDRIQQNTHHDAQDRVEGMANFFFFFQYQNRGYLMFKFSGQGIPSWDGLAWHKSWY